MNHDGVSGPGELHTLPSLDVTRIHLDYKESKRTDARGNRFRSRAKADGAKGARVEPLGVGRVPRRGAVAGCREQVVPRSGRPLEV